MQRNESAISKQEIRKLTASPLSPLLPWWAANTLPISNPSWRLKRLNNLHVSSFHWIAHLSPHNRPIETEKNLFTAKQIISVTIKMNLWGRLPGRKFPPSWPPMLIQMYILHASRRKSDLSVVGKISGVYRQTTPNAPEIPSFPIMLNVTLSGTNDTSPSNSTI